MQEQLNETYRSLSLESKKDSSVSFKSTDLRVVLKANK